MPAAPRTRDVATARHHEQGMLLVEALVALAIVAMVTISYIGIRTDALIDATRARNWRLAREIAEERLSILQAGAHEVPPQSGTEMPLEKYRGFSYKIVLGETNVSDLEAEIAQESAGGDEEAGERFAWEQSREDMRRASELGLNRQEYEDQQLEDINDRLAAQAPSSSDFEEVAVVVYFPKLDPDYEGQREALLIRARVSTLAISGLTPDQAESLSQANGDTASDPAAGSGGGTPGGDR